MAPPTVRSGAKDAAVLSEEIRVYDLFTISAPRLTGFLLKLFVWIAESWICAPIRAKLLHDNKFPQTLQQTVYPEAPTTCPAHINLGAGTVPVHDVQNEDAVARTHRVAATTPGVANMLYCSVGSMPSKYPAALSCRLSHSSCFLTAFPAIIISSVLLSLRSANASQDQQQESSHPDTGLQQTSELHIQVASPPRLQSQSV